VARLDHPLGEQQVPGLEDFQFGEDDGVPDGVCHDLKMVGRVDEDSPAQVHAAHIEAANVGTQFDDVAHASFGPRKGGVRPRLRRIVRAGNEAGAWPGGQIDQYVSSA
jgi:hypothetical protein